MCDERERLLDYLYDACDPAERRRVDAHLSGCETCREELSGLRAVRLDLQSWTVPDRDSVWKPFVPRRVPSWWRDVPAWTLAAAASVMFLLGMGGGLLARLVAPPVAVVQQAPPVAPVLQAAPTLTAAQASAMEQRVLTALIARLDSQPVAAHAQPASLVLTPVMKQQIEAQMRALIAESELRQGQAIGTAMFKVMGDADKSFVRRAQFNTFRNQELPQTVQWAMTQALMQQGGR